jgi:hypothetical protein
MQGLTALAAMVVGAMGIAGAAHAETVTVSAADCRRLVNHRPSDDVAYKPGMDVHGRAVAPADLGGGYPAMGVVDEIDIPISVDLADRLGRARARSVGIGKPTTAARPLPPYEGHVPVGTVTIKGNDVLWDGEPLLPKDEAVLATACRARLEQATPPPQKPSQPQP